MITSALAPAQVSAQTIRATGNMAFGRFAAGSGGAITVPPVGSRTKTGGVILLPATATPAGFNVVVPGNGKQVILTLPPNGTAALSSGANTMPLTNFVSNKPSGVLGTGVQSLLVGATLQVAPKQPAGAYTGSFHVTVEYQ